jgi:integrase
VDHHQKTLYTEGVVIKQLFRWANSRKLIVENLIADYRLEKPPLEAKAGPSLEQIDFILAACRGMFMVILAVLAFTGMRSGELQHLRKKTWIWPATGCTSFHDQTHRQRRKRRRKSRWWPSQASITRCGMPLFTSLVSKCSKRSFSFFVEIQ